MRISDALGTATEIRAMRNYAGHRLAPWLAHVMVCRQETSRQLLTPGEIMQLPASDELVLVSGAPPIRASKFRYFEDRRFSARLLPSPVLDQATYGDRPAERSHDWSGCVAPHQATLPPAQSAESLDGKGADSDGPAHLVGCMELPELHDRRGRPVPRHPKTPEPSPIVGAHALNQGSDRGCELMTSF